MADGPSSSALHNAPQIFLDTEGEALAVFVEAGGINNRPSLVRRLKRAGARICTDPKLARVILVKSSSDEGRQFIRDWGRDSNKVVLESAWADKCITAGRIFREEDQWGGCIAVDDGLSIGMMDEDDEDNNLKKSPLPTPRETPVDTYPSSQKIRRAKPSAGPSTEQIRKSTTDPIPPPRIPNDLPQNYPDPSTCVGGDMLNNFQSPSIGGYPIQPQQAISQFPGAQAFNNMMMAGFLTQQPGLAPNGTAENPFLSAFLDAMRVRGLVPGGFNIPGNSLQSQMPVYNHLPDMGPIQPPMHSGYPGLDVNGNNPAGNASDSPSALQSSSSTPAIPSPMLPPSISRRYTNSSPIQSSPKEGNRTEASSSAGPHGAWEISQPGSEPQQAKQRIFTTKSGKEIIFFVQVDINNRFKLVNAIKKHGGKITTEPSMADYAVLYSKSTSFKQLCQNAVAAGKPPVKSSFVNECITQGTLLDATPFLHEKPAVKRKHSSLENDSEAESSDDVENSSDAEERKRLVKNQRQRDRREKERKKLNEGVKKNSKVAKGGGKATPNQTPRKADADKKNVERQPRSPTPPAEHLREHTFAGSEYFKYSEYEREYVLKYAKVLLERDYQISMHAIASALYKKMPHHTVKSWRTFIANNYGNEIDNIRKRGAIAFRKAQSQQEAQTLKEKDKQLAVEEIEQDLVSSQQPLRASLPDATPTDNAATAETQYENPEKEDIETLARFFAFQGGDEDGQDDTEVWARLRNQVRCKTAGSWEEFWNKHNEEVNARYQHYLAKSVTQAEVAP